MSATPWTDSFGPTFIVACFALLALLVAAFYAFRYRNIIDANKEALAAQVATSKAWKEERDAALDHRKRLEDKLDDAKEKIAKLEGQVLELSNRPDLREHEAHLVELRSQMAKHEEAAAARTERLLGSIEALITRIGTPAPVVTHVHTEGAKQ